MLRVHRPRRAAPSICQTEALRAIAPVMWSSVQVGDGYDVNAMTLGSVEQRVRKAADEYASETWPELVAMLGELDQALARV